MKKPYTQPMSEIRRWQATTIVTVSSLVGWDDDWEIGNDAVESGSPTLPFVPF